MVKVAEVVALQTGVLEWDQPERQRYQPNTPLAVRLRVTNPTDAAREYQLYMGLYHPETAQLIQGTYSLIKVDGQESFSVAASSYVEMQGEITVDRTNVFLGIFLHDVAADEVVSGVGTLLEAAPSIFEQLTPLIGVGVIGAAVGMVLPMTRKMFKKK